VERSKGATVERGTMTVFISSDAEEDLVNSYWFYERQSLGLVTISEVA
jgi:hypothetical protein